MKMVILAAGKGTRLMPLTKNRPKCMVEYKHKALIDYILDSAKMCGIQDIAIVDGYKRDILKEYVKYKNLTFFTNCEYKNSNMVHSLFCAKDFFDDDVIISYSDIIYKKDVLQKLVEHKGDLLVIVDKNWKSLWKKRMENPLLDAETLKIVDGKIVEIGKKPKSYEDIDAQYIGLFKISKKVAEKIFALNYQKYEYMTDFLQKIIDNGIVDIKPIYIEGGWMEFDTLKDLKIEYEN